MCVMYLNGEMGHRGKKESARRMIASGRLAVEEIAEYAGVSVPA